MFDSGKNFPKTGFSLMFVYDKIAYKKLGLGDISNVHNIFMMIMMTLQAI